MGYARNKIVFCFLFFFPLCSLLLACVSVSSLRDRTPGDILKQEIQKEFDSDRVQGEEVYRVLVSSEEYLRKQVQSEEIFSFKKDESSDLAFCKELSVYDKINYKSKAVVKVSLYEDSGTLSKVRFVHSSGISEVDQLIAEDITRWRFDFLTRKIPKLFHVSFYIFLRGQVTKEQVKEELKRFVQ